MFPPVDHQTLAVVGSRHALAKKTLGVGAGQFQGALQLRHLLVAGHVGQPPRRPDLILRHGFESFEER
jgi:hypothetical protein